ncbi:putative lipid II flippase FtsW [Treponema phagedenis]|uniref:Probable peptidoglycan glycosyltransferase FtsW n=1 Tax=Treponema phagedenis TaxID=162 RepID=A0A0B7GV11_TREPH|nr:putative lipid II flippase FtsW [Treponema phagedenis]NVP24561.1 putative lipid II flippase FtsW [Treponema phagedenis]QEJ97678.1 putative lipid II flippase FtsW [Treponema phagedenis]QEK00647.1 putative lipid II flippase FtsW [Treponema phagedenis]QEK03246.1 putative lipid II flippase FtsW [Treponema phagedenis]QEK05656.1 putative lipid II flippase FtsW [Treponema phagedenis]
MNTAISIERNIYYEKYSFVFVMLTILLTGLGLATLYSGSVHYAQRFFDNPLYFLTKQTISLGIAFLCFLFFMLIDLAALRKLIPFMLIASFLLCVLVFIPGLGISKNGATRWLNLFYLKFQPSEFVKLVLVIFLANFFDKNKEHFDMPMKSILPPFFVSAIFVLLVYFQNDFSTSMFLLFIVLVMFFIAGASILWFIKGSLVLLPMAVLMVITSTHRMRRVLSFLYPDHDPLGAGYQVNAASEALTGGGLWGMGIGNGIRKIASVPEVYSDFIFVVLGEEMGFIGVCAYLLLLLATSITGIIIALRSSGRFGTFLAFGATAAIVFQSILNLAVVVRLVPATGMPLPFFSFGGSSLIITLSFCGIIINVSGLKKGGAYV